MRLPLGQLTSPHLDREALQDLAFADKMTVHLLRSGYAAEIKEREMRAEVVKLLNPGARDGLTRSHTRAEEIITLAEGDMINVVVNAHERDTSWWRVVHDGRLHMEAYQTKALAVLSWLDLEANGGSSSGGTMFAGRVLGLPEAN